MNIRQYIPTWIKPFLRTIRGKLYKASLTYLEVNLTDHCNMNCEGCTHFSPLAPPVFANPSQHRHDMERLTQLFSNIRTIRLMGGEPLLHPEVTSFLNSTRSAFPKSDIHLVTNGILLHKMADDFWIACKRNNIHIDITIYPPMLPRREALTALVGSKGLSVNAIVSTEFFANLNLRGDSDPKLAMQICREKYCCPFLQNGRLYVCAFPALAHYFNAAFGNKLPTGGGVDIHAKGLNGWRVIETLNQPTPNCSYCGYDYRNFHWAVSKKKQEGWDSVAVK